MQLQPGERILASSSWVEVRRGWISSNSTHTLIITDRRISLQPNMLWRVMTLGRAQPIEVRFDQMTSIGLRDTILWNRSIRVLWRAFGKEHRLRIDYLKRGDDTVAAALQQMVPKEKWRGNA